MADHDAAQPVPLASGPRGMRLLAFERLPENAPPGDHPVGYVLVVLSHRGRWMMVHVRGRDCWELPGGGIETGESPRQAAIRELREESGQRIDAGALRFAGFAKTGLRDRATQYGAVYTAEARTRMPYAATEEIRAIHWWDGVEPLPSGTVQSVDTYLAGLVLGPAAAPPPGDGGR